jgi:hypothetical protein
MHLCFHHGIINKKDNCSAFVFGVLLNAQLQTLLCIRKQWKSGYLKRLGVPVFCSGLRWGVSFRCVY